MQAAVWAAAAGGRGGAHDLAVASPTGSGKTLAYGLPAAHSLLDPAGARRRRTALGVLIVVPTRDLAAQVGGVLTPLFGCLGLTVAVAAGGRDPAGEAAAIAGAAAAAADTSCGDYAPSPSAPPADAVVTTPGRLAAHLARLGPEQAKAALSGLRFIVVDEADRLLTQHYSHWLPTLNAAAPAPDGGGGASSRCVRVAASATLTRDPARVGRLSLWRPRYVAAEAGRMVVEGETEGHPATTAQPFLTKYALPASLRLARLDVRRGGGDKPACLLAALRQLAETGTPALIFCGSVATAASVAAFLGAVQPPLLPENAGGGRIALLTSAVPPRARSETLASLAAGATPLAVASDGATRGLDAPSIGAVINYDLPSNAKGFVHRAGRTARAGRAGVAISLVRPVDGRHYADLVTRLGGAGGGGSGGGGSVWRVPQSVVVAARGDAAAALAAAGEEGGAAVA